MAGWNDAADVHDEQAVAVERIVRAFALAAIALVAVLLPLTFVEGLGAGLPDTVRTAAGLGLLGGHLLAARAPWASMIRTRRGRVLLDLYPFVMMTSLVPLPVLHGGNQPVFWGVALLLGFAAMFTSTRMFGVLIGMTLAMYGGTAARFSDEIDTIALLSALGSTLFLASLTRLAGQRFQQALGEVSRLRHEAVAHAGRLRAVARGARAVSHPETDDVLQAVADATADLGWDVGALFVPDAGDFVVRGHRGLDAEVISQDVRDGSDVVAAALRHDQTIVQDRDGHLGTLVGTPIHVHGEVRGVVVVASRDHRPVPDGEAEALELLAAQAGRAMELALRHESQGRTITELQELDRLKSDFLSTVSHEIRTPITVILGMAETVDERWDGLDDPRRLELLRRLRSNADGLQTVISNLLDFAKLERGRVDATLAPVDVAGLCRDVVSRLDLLLVEHEVTLHTDAMAVALADGPLIERVVENLVVNAIRHTPAGSEIRVGVDRSPEQVRVSVADNGPGMTAADVARLGERFFRGTGAATRATRGVGLGLAFCKQILELHESELEVASTPGEGARFAFDLAAAPTAPV